MDQQHSSTYAALSANPSPTFTPLFNTPRPRLLLIAATGGHLLQLTRFAQRENAADDSLWVTFRSPQSESLLDGKRVHYVDYVAPRDWKKTIAAYRTLAENYSAKEFDGALSTGSAVGVAGIAWAARHRIPRTYIESVSRTEGPSLSGKLLSLSRLCKTYTQHPRWASNRWMLTGSVMAGFQESQKTRIKSPTDPMKIFVTLGTIRPYRFDRLVDSVLTILRPSDEVVWQLGETTRSDLPGTVHSEMPQSAMYAAAKHADVVITHSGVGTILQLLDHGVCPIVVPRSAQHDEHVDNHQSLIWEHLRAEGLGVLETPATLSRESFARAASTQISQKGMQS